MSEAGQVYYRQKWWKLHWLVSAGAQSEESTTALPLCSRQWEGSTVAPGFSSLPPKIQKPMSFIEKFPNFSLLTTSWNSKTLQIKQNISLRWFRPEATFERMCENCFQKGRWGVMSKKLRLWAQIGLGLNGLC